MSASHEDAPPPGSTLPPSGEVKLLATLLRLETKIDALTSRVGAIDSGLVGVNDELSALRSDMRQGFEGVKLWLFGENADKRTIRTGMAHHVAAASELGKSALDRAAAAADTAERALTVAHEALSLAQHPPHAANGAAGAAE